MAIEMWKEAPYDVKMLEDDLKALECDKRQKELSELRRYQAVAEII